MAIPQPFSSTRSPHPSDPYYNGRQPFVFNGLRTLKLSCVSFPHSDPLFSIACALFDKNTGGGIPGVCSLYTVSVSLSHTVSVFGFHPSIVDHEPSPAPKAQKRLSASPLLATLTHSPSRNPFACHSYAN